MSRLLTSAPYSVTPAPVPAMPRPPRWLPRLAAMSAVGAVVGWLVWWLHEPETLQAWLGAGLPLRGALAVEFWRPTLAGAAYASAMWEAMLAARRRLYRRVPLHDARTAAVHVLGVAAAATGAFAVVTAVEAAVCAALDVDDGGGSPFGAIVGVSFGFTVVVATALYLVDFFRRSRRAEQAAVAAELRALRAQINPHFLFNALNSVAALTRTRPAEAEGVVERLAALFRYTLRASERPVVPLADEVEGVRLYLDVEAVRFGDRLQAVVEVPDALAGVAVPSLSLQTLVENAVKHGVAETEGPCAVLVRAERVGGPGGPAVECTVRDTGPGFATVGPEVFARGTGLRNVRDRLALLFGDDTAFEVLPDGVRLRFPLRQLEPRGGAGARPAALPRAA